MSADTSIHARILFALAGHSYHGLRLAQIAEGIGESAPTTLRALQRALQDGLVEVPPRAEKSWRLSPRIVQIAIQHQTEVMTEEHRLSEFTGRYSRLPS